MNEIALRFIIDEVTSKRLWVQVEELKLASGNRRTKTLEYLYLDTPGMALKNAGIALWLQRDGRKWTQAVSTAEAGGMGETENRAPGGRVCLDAIPDISVRDEVLRQVNGSPLQPFCESLVKH